METKFSVQIYAWSKFINKFVLFIFKNTSSNKKKSM